MLQKLFVPKAYFKGFGHSIKTGVTCPQVVSDDKNTVSPILALIKDNYPQWNGDDHGKYIISRKIKTSYLFYFFVKHCH